jgi:hypothetical protein
MTNDCKVSDSRCRKPADRITLFCLHLYENCAVKLLQPRRNLNSICDRRTVEIYNSVWVQLGNNEWIYFIPTTDNLTVICRKMNVVICI